MQTLPTQEQGHLIVAGLRVLTHQNGRAASDSELAELLSLPEEETSHFLRGLTRHGVLERVESAFDARYDIIDHRLLETLPGSSDESELKKEVAAFQQRTEERSRSLDEIFGENPDELAKKRASKLTDELKKFQSNMKKSPFRDPEED